MPEKNPLEHLVNQVGEILQLIHDNEKKPLNPKIEEDLIKRVERLEMIYSLYKELSDKAFEQAGGKEIELKKSKDQMDPQQRKMLDRIGDMQKDLTRMQVGLNRALNKFKKESPEGKKEAASKAHKKKFKRFGQDEKWMRL